MPALKLARLSAVLLFAMAALPLSSVAWAEAKERSPSINQTAQRITRDLTAQGYEVTQGYPMLYTQQDCDGYSYPIILNCLGNNPASPYVFPVVKSWPEEFVDPATVNAFGRTRQGYSATYRLDPREAIIVLGELPPPGRYIGLQSYVWTKEWLTPDAPFDTSAPVYQAVQVLAPELIDYLFGTVPRNPSRILSVSTLSNAINNVIIERQSGAAFGQTRYFIITPDQAMDRAVRSSLALAGVSAEHVFTEPIPRRDEVGEMGPLGLDSTADDFVTAIRYARPYNEHAAHTWWTNLPLAVLRVRESPSSDRPAEPFPPFVVDARTAEPEDVYADDLNNLVGQVCLRWGQACDTRQLIDMQLDLGLFGPKCRAIGQDCLGDQQESSQFVAPSRVLDPGWVYAMVGTLGTATGNATYMGLSINDMSKLKGVLDVSDTRLAGSAASYSGTVNNTGKFYVHYFARNCNAIESLTDGECSAITEDMVPLLGESPQGLFSVIVRSYIRPGTARGPLSSEQLRPVILRFAQP
jgi:hypothetical protein